MKPIVLSLATALILMQSLTAQDAIIPGTKGVIKFEGSLEQLVAPDQLQNRTSAVENPPPYDVTKEEFEILLPKGYDKTKPYGLLIWIGAGGPNIPKSWESVLAENDLILVAARNSGNQRNIFDRFRLALDANYNLRELYNIDGRRVYVSGFSGGSRVASMLGVCWAEMFSGTICFMGVNFYEPVAAEDGKTYGLSYLPDDQVLALAKQYCRYVLVTGEKDFNLPNTRAAYTEGFQKEKFNAVKKLEVPGLGHKLPDETWLRQALEFLDEVKR